jgi:hypothetical protein
MGVEMNSEELKIYTALTHPTAPESYRITDNGTKLWTIEQGSLICFEGEELDKMSASSLYFWYREKLTEYYEKLWEF